MSRESALVSADWAEKNLEHTGRRLRRGRRGHHRVRRRPHRRRDQARLAPDLQDPVRRDFVNKEQFEALLSSRGIGNDDTVVLYGGNNNWFAAYAYWYFKLYGHGDVKLLDGGRKKWELDARPLVKDVPQRTPTTVHGQGAGPVDPRLPRRRGRGDRRAEPRRRPLARRVRRPPARPRAPAAGAGAAGRPHPDRDQRAVVQGRQRGRHLQVRQRAGRALRAVGSTTARTPSRTAASASAPRTPGSCCRRSSASRT